MKSDVKEETLISIQGLMTIKTKSQHQFNKKKRFEYF